MRLNNTTKQRRYYKFLHVPRIASFYSAINLSGIVCSSQYKKETNIISVDVVSDEVIDIVDLSTIAKLHRKNAIRCVFVVNFWHLETSECDPN